MELPLPLHGTIKKCFDSLILRVGWANARDVNTVYHLMKSTRECRLDDADDADDADDDAESNQSDEGDEGDKDDKDEEGGPYIMSDAITALENMIGQRKLLREVDQSTPSNILDQMVSRVQSMSMSHASPPMEMAAQRSKLAELVEEEEEKKVEEKEAEEVEEEEEEKEVMEEKVEEEEEEEDDLDPDTVWSSLDEALSEKGYTIYTTRDLLRSGSLPADLLELVARKVSSKPEKVKPMLVAQCPILLPRVLSVIKVIEEELEMQRLVRDEIERANETERVAMRAKEKIRQEEAVMQRVQMIGKCCAGFHWIKQSGGYRCAGGSHYVSDKMINTHKN